MKLNNYMLNKIGIVVAFYEAKTQYLFHIYKHIYKNKGRP